MNDKNRHCDKCLFHILTLCVCYAPNTSYEIEYENNEKVIKWVLIERSNVTFVDKIDLWKPNKITTKCEIIQLSGQHNFLFSLRDINIPWDFWQPNLFSFRNVKFTFRSRVQTLSSTSSACVLRLGVNKSIHRLNVRGQPDISGVSKTRDALIVCSFDPKL